VVTGDWHLGPISTDGRWIISRINTPFKMFNKTFNFHHMIKVGLHDVSTRYIGYSVVKFDEFFLPKIFMKCFKKFHDVLSKWGSWGGLAQWPGRRFLAGELSLIYAWSTGGGKKVTPYKLFCSFLSSRLEFQSTILPTYLVILYTHKSFISIISF